RAGLAPRCVAGAAACCARVRDGDGDVDLAAPRCRLERDLDEVLDVLTPLRRPRPVTGPLLLLTAPVEERAEQVAQPAEVAEVLEGKALLVDGARTRARRAPTEAEASERTHLAHLVVLPALLVVRQHRIRLADLLEPLGRLRIVGARGAVALLREPAVCLLDLIGARVLRDAEYLIVVRPGSRLHPLSPRADTRARAGVAPDDPGTGSPSGRRPRPARPGRDRSL